METSHQQNLSDEEQDDLQRHDSMPDLTWPEKKSNDNKITASESHDTGFGSEVMGDALSPTEDSKSISEALDQNEAESSAAEDDIGDKNEEQVEEDMDILGNGMLVKKVWAQ